MTFAKYQLTETLPYWFKRGILFQKDAKLRPLYKEEHTGRVNDEDAHESSGKVSG